MILESAWVGVHSLLNNYVGIEDGDHIILVYSEECLKQVSLVSLFLRNAGMKTTSIPMSPLIDRGFSSRLESALPNFEEVDNRLVVLTFERETMSHDRELRQALAPFPPDQCMVFRSISTCDELFTHALQPSPLELSALNTTILENCMPAKRIELWTDGGTDLVVQINSDRHRWISNRGHWREGSFVILPAGEVATYPTSVDGVLVADFAFNVNALTEQDSRLHENPITVEISNGRAVNYHCNNADIMNFLDDCFTKYCAFNVGELGLGTNVSIERPISLNSHINERKPGIHIGFGQHNQGDAVDYRCDIHLDLICNGGYLKTDRNVTIDLSNVQPSSSVHPQRTRDEDVFSPLIDDLEIDDCCGVLTKDGLRPFRS
ncbi:hypothetical protein J7444_08280 [Labrenzia sp. R4_1]|uniref:hypothetical protein n=1 Tax=Labrenzia sp. R4_1 TaxID=2821106 RepID=UPI001ADB45C6|nr:hypothetical protein [Labrenzia sp. R4_1]MBO9424715.1 hypothetical protein [Labrenzia sp. R4_1]